MAKELSRAIPPRTSPCRPTAAARRELADFKGKPVVVYFYSEGRHVRLHRRGDRLQRAQKEFDAAGAVVIGVSPDSVASHEKFKTKHNLALALAADPERSAIEAYGVWQEKSMYGRKYFGVERSTFLIGRDGRIAQVWRKVKVPKHAEAVLAAVKAL